ncbi:MAG TPA: chromosome segregation protein SMC [Candidatus Woesearchaeota archaeon]|nr:chromosome segregation protein SMC [Candidatus Woesearchaeota archaeon]
MTQIKKLVMNGFKSFAKRTELNFGNNFNVILGPNGSGKSNVLDAICFVLGRMSAKSMRVERGSNLIYNGGPKGKTLEKAEVSIEFDNSKKEFPLEGDVKISRIIHQSGQSDYRINNKRTTRQNVIDLLSAAKINPEGYNITLQGDITKFIEMSSNEKRQIIEEISGISIYQEKKAKAESELSKVEEKLKEADIILNERKNYLKDLKKERDQALKYKEMKDKIDQNRATYLNIQLTKKNVELEEIKSKATKINVEVEKANSKIEQYKKKISDNKNKSEEISKHIEEKGQKEQIELNREIEGLKVDFEKNKIILENHKREKEKLSERKIAIENEISDIESKILLSQSLVKENESILLAKNKDIELIKTKVQKIKKDYNLENIGDIESSLEKNDKEIEELSAEANSLREIQQSLLREKDRLALELEMISKEAEKIEGLKKEHKKEISELESKKDEFKKATLLLNNLLNDDSKISLEIGELKKKSISLRERLESLKIKSESIKQSQAFDVSLKKILELKSKYSGIYGKISDLGTTQAKYSSALDATAGGSMNYIVVDNDQTATICIKYLKENKLGSAVFIPLNKIRYSDPTPEQKKLLATTGAIDFAINLVKCDPKFRNAFKFVFGSTIVVNDIDVSRRIGIGKIRMVTLDGDLTETSGLMRGGFNKTKRVSGFKSEEFSKEMEELEISVQKSDSQISKLAREKDEIESKISELRNKKASLEGEIIKLSKGLYLDENTLDVSSTKVDILKKESGRVDNELSKIVSKISELNKKLAGLKIDKQKLKESISKMKDPAKVAELTTYEETLRKLERDIFEKEPIIKLEKDKIESYKKEVDDSKQAIKELDKEDLKITKEINELCKRIENINKEITQKEGKAEKFYVEFKELFEKRSKLEKENQVIDNEINSIFSESRTLEQKYNLLSLQIVQAEGEKSNLCKQLEPYVKVELIKNPDEEQIKKEIARFEMLVESIGTVNMKALEIYDLAEGEYNKFLDKKKTLESEREEVLKLIKSLEHKKKEKFFDIFEKTNDNFKKMFSELSTKDSSAYLELENPESPFEGGMNLKVKISGNRYLDLRSLSGGEKSLTALAFIFSVQEFEPASFYVLDEVDSALDKKNSEKLAQLIKKYSKRAQYVVISHNDEMISEGDLLFGASMDKATLISKIISVRV